MNENKETPESTRERMRQEEWRGNPTGNANDAITRAETGSLSTLADGLGWKGIGILIVVIIIIFVVGSIFFT
ncbi:hypothetical protein I6N90_01745 [Paenibacillus sp. GSMTC-2017]|uniref:DUF6366 family protein n=1 Tax=Paenibacillus sp. GSMTC-2017 TaxID=2794350 RepID=UPI0018D97ED4|nr:hypothetical protein [Paenibacillus sp. GSMTC-2017]